MADRTGFPSTPSRRRTGTSPVVRRASFLLPLLTLATASPAQDALLRGRPGFSAAEQPAAAPASCDDLESQLAGLPTPSTRVDLTIIGAVTLIQTDGALWYVAVCRSPGTRVLCVAYEGNGLKLGDRALLRGGYNRQDDKHVVLDPCLASRA